MNDLTDAARGRWLHVGPPLPGADPSCRLGGYPECSGDTGVAAFCVAHLPDLVSIKNGSRISESTVICAVIEFVSHVGPWCIPSQIHQPVVEADAVAMAGMKPIWPRPSKCFQHQNVNQPPVRFAILAKSKVKVPLGQGRCFHNASLEGAQTTTRVSNLTRQATNPPQVADFVTPLKTKSGHPVLGGA